ncbi:MBL fold metallo-hydrolase [Kineothrix sp. MB12-C1]|uniref:MBL fold metallo-hydrolase n=1 Tax=Kineothrix sp. MB12-C1 TaxID=3070215 RepID=UPI0027D235A5|nr:MBL fold metallo-hydrolase [Kineothrix sp. MB12-C1]WMC92630.1 MBL fold metallo-hydrolase [Kineothrix sp. MB12-C1]
MRLCSIASGSSGNCIYVGSDTTHLLVDVGISGKRTKEGLENLGVKPEEIDGIFITHEHNDHISGLGVMARKYGIPIYGTRGTLQAIKNTSSVGSIDTALFQEIEADNKVTVKDIVLNPMSISHDAAQPVAYRVCHGKQKLGIITDLGCYNDYTVECLRGMNVLLMEANHDVNMLQVGPYPYYLKKRILGDRGHLSNELCGRLLSRVLHDDMQKVILGHLSKENNLPELAYEAVRVELTMSDSGYKVGDFPIQVANRSEISELIEIA